MTGNCHVPFLGGGTTVTPSRYPTAAGPTNGAGELRLRPLGMGAEQGPQRDAIGNPAFLHARGGLRGAYTGGEIPGLDVGTSVGS